uniref:copper resistance CopC family protein n=1 Tax=Cellulosimicrobium cellulans TaxID=1710 RepID=UPI0005B9D59E
MPRPRSCSRSSRAARPRPTPSSWATDPQDGTVLDAPPDALTLTFNEPVQVVPGGTTVLAADGTPVDVDVAAVDDALVVTPGTVLGDGTYVVSWRVVSLD